MTNPAENVNNKHLFLKVILIYISFVLLEIIALHFSAVLEFLGLYSASLIGAYYDNYMDIILYNFILLNLFTAVSFYIKAKYGLPFHTKSSRLGIIFSILIIVFVLLIAVISVVFEQINLGELFADSSTLYHVFQFVFYVSASLLNMYMLSFVLIPAGIRSVIKNKIARITLEIIAACFAFSIIEVFDWMDFSYLLDQATLVLPVALVMVLSRKHYLAFPLFLFINLGLGIYTSDSFSMKFFPWFLVIYPINIAFIIFFNRRSKTSRT